MISTFQIPTHIQTNLRLVENKMLSQTDGYNPDLGAALQILLSSGGKRIRPLIILLVGEMLHGPESNLINLATAIELLHTATLVHDDLIDGSLLRRGVPTLNSHWSPAATVLTGDFLFSRSALLAAETNHNEVIKLFSRTLTVIVNGEINQLFTSPCNTSKEDYYQRIYAKTSSLFETSTQSAALLSNANEEQITDIKKYGYCLGMAFQIIDDLLDYIGDESKVGKPVGGDLRQGLITLPLLYYLDSHPNDPATIRLSNHKCITEENEILRIIQSIKESNVIEKTLDEANGFIQEAIKSLDVFEDGSAKQSLISLASFTVDRTV
ncbi:MAG: polyprenyl synthetase family protein [Anaerolineaceae bacterium]